MTFLFAALLGAGLLMIISSVEGSSLADTARRMVAGEAIDLSPAPPEAPAKAERVPAVPAFPADTRRIAWVPHQREGWVHPSPVTFSEWFEIAGGVASCVETSGAILLALTQGRPISQQEIRGMVRDLYARHQASAQGVTTWRAEAQQLERMGQPVEYTSSYSYDRLRAALISHKPVVLGFQNADALRDTLTGRYWNRGVQGHSITVEGYDQAGVFAADPNTPSGTGLVHYSWADLHRARAMAMIVPR